MATTRIIPMHINKGKTISQCMKARIDYVKNPDKTEDGTLISSYECTPESADHEFVLARNEYMSLVGKQNPNEVIAYQLRQSFKPGEVTAEEANDYHTGHTVLCVQTLIQLSSPSLRHCCYC